MAQLLANHAEDDLVGYKQSFAGACWQMPELASAGGDLAVPLEKMCREELLRGLISKSSATAGDTSVSTVIDTLMSKHMLILSQIES